jgi:hypothetical protein
MDLFLEQLLNTYPMYETDNTRGTLVEADMRVESPDSPLLLVIRLSGVLRSSKGSICRGTASKVLILVSICIFTMSSLCDLAQTTHFSDS